MTVEISTYIDVKKRVADLGLNQPDSLTIPPQNFDAATSKDELLHEKYSPAQGRDAHELAALGGAHGEAVDDLLLLGDHTLYDFTYVRESAPPRGDRRGQSFATWRRARERMMVETPFRLLFREFLLGSSVNRVAPYLFSTGTAALLLSVVLSARWPCSGRA